MSSFFLGGGIFSEYIPTWIQLGGQNTFSRMMKKLFGGL
jgi:hypothetical protein